MAEPPSRFAGRSAFRATFGSPSKRRGRPSEEPRPRAPNVRSGGDAHGVVDPLAEVVEALVVEVVVAAGVVVVVVGAGAAVTLGVAMGVFSGT